MSFFRYSDEYQRGGVASTITMNFDALIANWADIDFSIGTGKTMGSHRRSLREAGIPYREPLPSV